MPWFFFDLKSFSFPLVSVPEARDCQVRKINQSRWQLEMWRLWNCHMMLQMLSFPNFRIRLGRFRGGCWMLKMSLSSQNPRDVNCQTEAGRIFGQNYCYLCLPHSCRLSSVLSEGHCQAGCWTVCKLLTRPLKCQSSVINFSTDWFSSLLLNYCHFPDTESHQWRVCCCSAGKPAARCCCWERSLQRQREICHSWETRGKSVAWVKKAPH